jgi:hypothetical protein
MTAKEKFKEIHDVLKTHTWVYVSDRDLKTMGRVPLDVCPRRVCSICHIVEKYYKKEKKWALSNKSMSNLSDRLDMIAINLVKGNRIGRI